MLISGVSDTLVGRTVELDRLVQAVVDPSVALVLVSGVPGVGRTMLLESFAEQAGRRGWRVDIASGLHTGRSYPLAPFLHLLEPDGPSAHPTQDLRRLLLVLGRRAEGTGAVVVVDDAHLLDDGSLALLSQLVSSNPPVPGDGPTVVASVDDLDTAPEQFVDAASSQRGRIVELEPLDREASDELVRMLVESPPAELQHAIWRSARGLPLFAAELVRGAIEHGSLVRSEQGWELVGAPVASERLSGVLRHRLDRHDAAERLVIRALAISGPLPARVVDHLAGAAQIERLERTGLVRWIHGPRSGDLQDGAQDGAQDEALATGQVAGDARNAGGDGDGRARRADHPPEGGLGLLTLVHDLVGVEVRHTMSPTAHSEVVDRLVAAARAEGLRGAGPQDGRRPGPQVRQDPQDLLLLAELLLGLGAADAPVLLAAADLALRRGDVDDSLRLVHATMSAGGGFDAEVLRAAALGRAGRDREAVELFEDLERRATGSAPRAAVAYRHAVHLAQQCAAPADAARLLERSIAGLAEEDAAPLIGLLASIHHQLGCPLDAIAVAEPLARGDRVPPDVLPGLMGSWTMVGRPAEALALAGRDWTTDAPPVAVDEIVAHQVWNRLVALWQVGGLGGLDDPLEGLASDRRAILDPTWAEVMRVQLAALQGHLDDAAALAAPLQGRLRATPTLLGVAQVSLVATVHSMRGDLAGARELLDVVEARPPATSCAFRWWMERAMVAWLAGLGDLDEAVRSSLALADGHAGEEFHVTTSLHDVVRVGAAVRVVDRLAAQAERPGATWWDRQCHHHAEAMAAGDVEALMVTAGEFERAGLDLCALEAFAQAAGAAGTRPGASRAAPGAATRAALEVVRLRERCGRVRTPAVGAGPLGITARELTVARLAALGWSNGEIAAQLGTSVRTVGNQLQRVFDRLGVHSRRDLARALEPED